MDKRTVHRKGYSSLVMNSRLRVLGGRISNIRVSELPKDKNRSEVVCNVHFLDGTVQSFRVNKQDAGQVLLDMVYNHLGLMEREYFGLQHNEDSVDSPIGSKLRWLEPTKPIRKQLKGSFPCSLRFLVRFFIQDPNMLQQEQTKHFYFLQLKNDILEGRLNCPPSSAVVLASYTVQSELGDYSSSEHPPGYLSKFHFIPDQDEDFLTRVGSLHNQHRGLRQSEAELCYLNIARTMEFYGVELHSARDPNNAELLIGIASGGLPVFRNMICTSFYSWVNIMKISFKRKRFFIQLRQKHGETREHNVAFSMLNYRACKNLWKSCVEHHTFFQAKRSVPRVKKLLSHNWTLGYKNPAKSINNQFCRKVIGGMVWNPVLRKSLSVEYLETKSLPSRSPPMTPNWRSPRLRHENRKPRHSSVDNLASEMTYITETEDVFYTYKEPPSSKDSDTESSQNHSPCRKSPDSEMPKKLLESSDTQQSSPRISHSHSLPPSPNGVGTQAQVNNRLSGTHPLDGVDKQFLASYDNTMRANNTDGDCQYYCDNNELIDAELLLLRITPDEEGRFGFNVKGGVDQKMPLVISRVSPDSPADLCTPKLLEGDQIVLINGRDISEHTHDQVVMFIKASRESHTKELALLVRRKVVKLHDEQMLEDEMDVSLPGDSILSTYPQYGTLEESMQQLKRGLESGTVLNQFEQLYRKKPGMTILCAKLPQNMDKNRYKDVLPYDNTRVALLEGEEDDYINANFVNMAIPSAGIVNKYVASQGPLPHTCSHFWQAVWEQHCAVIVMLTTLTERGKPKCHQYWPDPPEVKEYGNFQVCCHSEDCNIAYVFRELTVTNTETGEERSVTHLQYVAWPDHGVPDDPTDFLDFVNSVRQKRVENEPLFVHCSAGIGRTGVLVTMETSVELIEKNQPVYPLDIVRTMRDQRAMMVQTVGQYRFVCEAILRVYEEGLTKLQDSS
ncbi:tyrosine-protein phosphatase non-receptor type 3 isoform X2 [Acipenser ruthenus]|uniref:tyrosine-protein phosphatase non-receptor type 3 isoform X2 n=1 Tax=Acipenser ruthenus TaxID=7906 RepID=UPI00274182B9|nr:tyrosine-protein phosphatase non-receptor type 3 isoform X2 [Acipenser ruthenus]